MNNAEFITKLQNSIISYGTNQKPCDLAEDIINQSFEMLNSYLFDRDQVTIGLGEKGFHIDNKFFTGEELDKTFIKAFFNFLSETKISQILISRDFTLREYILFISLMSNPPGYFRKPDKILDLLREKEIRNIEFSFFKVSEQDFIKKEKKAVILSDDIKEYHDTSQEVYDASDKISAEQTQDGINPVELTQSKNPFIIKFESIVRHINSTVDKTVQKHEIIRNMINSLSPEAIIELINEYYDKEPDKNKNLIYPYIDYDKFILLSNHILMLVNDELRKDDPEQINYEYCQRLRNIICTLSIEHHLSKIIKVHSKCRVLDIIIAFRKDTKESIMSRSGLLKGKINVSEIVELLYHIDFDLSILDRSNISKRIINELLQNLNTSKDKIVEEGFKRIFKGLLDSCLEHNFESFSIIITNIFENIKDQKTITPLYSFACEIALYYSPLLIKKGHLQLLRNILHVLNMHRDTKAERSAEQWYKARLTINSIGQSQSMKDMIASFFWMDESKRSELLLTLSLIKETAVRYLLNLLAEAKEIKSRKGLIASLVSFGKDSIPEIVSELSKNHPWYYLRNLILILGKSNSPETAVYIKDYLNHDDKRVRKEAINSLISLKDPSAVNYLVPYLSSETEDDPFIVKKIIYSFEYAHPDNISFLIIKILNEELYSNIETEEEDIKQASCHIAGKLKLQDSIPVLRKLSSKKSLFGIHKGHCDSLRAAALYALHKIGGQDEEIRKFIKDDSPIVRSLVNEILKQ